MRRFLLLIGWIVVLAAPMAAPEASGPRTIRCSPPDTEAGAASGFTTFETLAERLNHAAPSLRLDGPVRQLATAQPTLNFTVVKPSEMNADAWRRSWFEAVVYPSDGSGAISARLMQRGEVQPPVPTDDRTVLTARLPGIDQGWWPSRWEVVLMLCTRSAAPAGSAREEPLLIEAFARAPLYASSLRLSAAAGMLVALGLYLALALASMQVQRSQLAALRDRLGGSAPSALGFALRPPVIAQDSFGHASLSRFQILMFTLALSGVYAYALIRTGELPNISGSVLALLGITLTGSALARATEGSSVDTANRIWLIGTGVIDSSARIPVWSDLIASDGEIDASRVQALVFSLFAAFALIAFGTADLQNFAIPDELNYLITISQGAYVAGRALPRDSAKRLNEEVRTIRDAENRVLTDPTDAAARKGFETARNALSSSLIEVFGERLNDARLRRLEPGDRTPPPRPLAGIGSTA